MIRTLKVGQAHFFILILKVGWARGSGGPGGILAPLHIFLPPLSTAMPILKVGRTLGTKGKEGFVSI